MNEPKEVEDVLAYIRNDERYFLSELSVVKELEDLSELFLRLEHSAYHTTADSILKLMDTELNNLERQERWQQFRAKYPKLKEAIERLLSSNLIDSWAKGRIQRLIPKLQLFETDLLRGTFMELDPLIRDRKYNEVDWNRVREIVSRLPKDLKELANADKQIEYAIRLSRLRARNIKISEVGVTEIKNPEQLNEVKKILAATVQLKYPRDPNFRADAIHLMPMFPRDLAQPSPGSNIPGFIVIVAYGPSSILEQYPELNFFGHVLLGYYSIPFHAEAGHGQYSDYYKHNKKIFMAFPDRLYIFPQFRGIITIPNRLFDFLEKLVREYGYGNIEIRPIESLVPLIERRGYTPQDGARYSLRWGKLL